MSVAFGPASRLGTDLLGIELSAGATIIRVHHQDKGAIFFGPKPGVPPQNRFDAPSGEYRMLYAAERLEGAFVESILRRPDGRILRPAFVNERAWTLLRLERAVTLAKVFDEGLQFHGVDASVSASDDYTEPRALALKLYINYPDLHGLAYRSRYNNGEICFAIFDRVPASELTVMSEYRFADYPNERDRLMALYGATFDVSAAL